MSGYLTGESADIFDPLNGRWVGVIDRQRREQIISAQEARATYLYRFWGIRSGVAANSALLDTRLIKFLSEVPFNAVRLHLMHYGSSTPTWKCAVAATETISTSSQANLAQPIVGGSAYNVIDSTSDSYGWRTATFGGAATKTFAGTGSVSTTDSSAEMASSDWIGVQSVSRSDGLGGYPLMVQLYPSNANVQNASWISVSGAASNRTPTTANRGRIVQLSRGGGDNVASPGSTTFSLVTDTSPVMVEVRTRAPSATVMAIGDSLTQNDSLVADSTNSWLIRACADVSGINAVVPCQMGGSSVSSAVYWREAQRVLALHRPSIAIYQCFTPNDAPFTNAGVTRYKLQLMESRVAEFLAYCKDSGVYPILDTGIPYSSGLDATTDALRKGFVAIVKSIASSHGAGLIDSDSFFSDGGSPAAILSAYSLGDGVHYNEAGVEAKATQLVAPAIRTALGLW